MMLGANSITVISKSIKSEPRLCFVHYSFKIQFAVITSIANESSPITIKEA